LFSPSLAESVHEVLAKEKHHPLQNAQLPNIELFLLPKMVDE
jgi:hypothetical protein